jgi:hypothetical protein
MSSLDNNQKNSSKVRSGATATLILLEILLLVIASVSTPLTVLGSISGGEETVAIDIDATRKAPAVVSANNIYIAWWTNNTENGNEEVMFRASNDGGSTFGDKINLSNTAEADSWRVEVAGEGADVVVSWWETDQTSDTPVARISKDGGATFGPMLRLATNGTIDSTAGG